MPISPSPVAAATPQGLVLLRWWLLGGLAIAVLATPTLLEIGLPLAPLLATLSLLAVFNLLVSRRAGALSAAGLARQLGIDLIGLAVILYLTGGAANPLVSLLLLPLAVAALSLPARWVAGIATLAVALYSLLSFVYIPLPITDAARAARLHLAGMWLTFVVSAVLLAWFVTRMMASLRERDARLALSRENTLRDAQVVALGQLAAGAAHELGTPLATISVLASELAADERLPTDVRDDLDLMRRQLSRCKEIVAGLTRQAGVERAGHTSSLADWVASTLARWRSQWPRVDCVLQIDTAGTCPQVITDPAIEQAIANLLDNAARAAPHALRVTLGWNATTWRLGIHDGGPGFPAAVLSTGGGEPLVIHPEGSGIGLWLTRAAVERAGGSLHLMNTDGGGLAVIELPVERKT